MSSPIDQAFNNIIEILDSEGPPSPRPISVDDEGTTQVESSSSSRSSSDYEPIAEVAFLQTILGNPQTLEMANALLEYRDARDNNHMPPVSPTLSETRSIATTDNLHPGWPYIAHTDLDYDLPQQNYERPYLAVSINPINGDPQIISRADREGAPYNEGELTAQSVEHVEEDLEEGTAGEYGIGGDAYLDSQFLTALGSLADRGLNAECLWMVQAECEKRSLEQWEGHLEARERALLTEWQGYQQAKRAHNAKVADIKIRLRRAKFASRMTPLLHDCSGAPAFPFPHHVGAHMTTGEGSRGERVPCHWCGGGRGLDMH